MPASQGTSVHTHPLQNTHSLSHTAPAAHPIKGLFQWKKCQAPEKPPIQSPLPRHLCCCSVGKVHYENKRCHHEQTPKAGLPKASHLSQLSFLFVSGEGSSPLLLLSDFTDTRRHCAILQQDHPHSRRTGATSPFVWTEDCIRT